MISLIWAMSENRVIGLDNRLPWYLPADLQHFKRLTLGKPIVMGRRTWESLPGLLPGRVHVVLTRDASYRAEGCTLARSLEEALTKTKDVAEVMIVGGATLYQAALPLADRLYLTLVHAEFAGDAFFPEFDLSQWCEVEREDHAADVRNTFPYSFITLERKVSRLSTHC